MHKSWAGHIQLMNKLWTSHEQILKKSQEHNMNMSWKSDNQVMNKWWTGYEQVETNKSWARHEYAKTNYQENPQPPTHPIIVSLEPYRATTKLLSIVEHE